MVNEKMEVAQTVGLRHRLPAIFDFTGLLNHLGEQDAGVPDQGGKDVRTGAQLNSSAGILACSKLQMPPDCRLVRG